MYLGEGRNIRLADTVGFITALPKELMNAFRATLEELDIADVLVHVIDASNPDWPRQRASVEAILDELRLRDKPTLLAFNKIDRLDAIARAALPVDAIAVSATENDGLDRLRSAILALV